MEPQRHRDTEDSKERDEKAVEYPHRDLTEAVIGAAIEVHKVLGQGLLESAYEAAMCHELELRLIPFQRQLSLPVVYKGLRLDVGYRIDMLVNDAVIVELKAVEKFSEIHTAQLLTYLRLSQKRVGLLINFNMPALKDGIKRRIL